MSNIRKYQVWRAEFPVQEIGKNDGGHMITVDGGEMHGAHRCVIVAVTERLVIVCPMTSAQDSRGMERHARPRSTWLRVYHQGKPAHILTEQMRAADVHRFNEQEGELGQHDADQLDLKLKALLGFI